MIRIAIGYVAVVVACALLILVNPMDFMGKAARQERLAAGVAEKARTIPTSEPAEQVASDQASGSIAATTAAILADLTAAAEAGGQTPAAPETAENAALRKMSEAVIAGLKGTPAAPQSLEMLVAQALAEGQTEKAIDEIVNAAVAEGAVAAPEGLTTTEGKVDTAVLLAAIEAEAQGDEFGQGDLSEPTELIESGTPSMQAATEDVLYVVRPGDSLGAIALRFYGKADLNGAIFKANRQVLDTPQSLRAGMKLLIPARSGL
jgi:nucleoid-associated protein YgaU